MTVILPISDVGDAQAIKINVFASGLEFGIEINEIAPENFI